MIRPIVSFPEFESCYVERLEQVFEFWNPEMQDEMGAHCAGWRSDRFDFRTYLERSVLRFHKAYASVAERGCRTVCDVGGFWGLLPIVLADLGYEVSMTEARGYYSKVFDPLFTFIEKQGVEIIDYDPFAGDAILDRTFDGVLALAILEHYPHSLKAFMQNIRGLMAGPGLLYIEVPNIAYWPKRYGLLRGASPLTPIEDIYESETPFIGHHHEFTMRELRVLARCSGLSVVGEDYYNYTESLRLAAAIRHPLRHLVPALVKTARECLVVVCTKNGHGGAG